MQSERFSHIPLRSVLYLAFGTGIVLALILYGLRPLQASLQRLDEETSALKARLEQQKVLAPLNRDFAQLLLTDASDRLPAPEKRGLSLDEIVGIPTQFQKLAAVSSLETISVAPEVKAFTRDRKFMPINLILKGNFLRLRKFLFALENLPYLEHVEEIQIHETGEGQEFQLKVWVAVNPRMSN